VSEALLKGKKIAILGGMGARGESKDALIVELGLAELRWVYSERNKVKGFAIFCESLYPGKYDYLFVLTKFINHKAWDQLKKAKEVGTPLIKINGSYNAEGFLKALEDQLGIKDHTQDEVIEAQVPIVKRILSQAIPDMSEVKLEPLREELRPTHKSNWELILVAATPEDAKDRHDKKVMALEAEIKRLSERQQDPGLLKSAASFYDAVAEFVGGYPVPVYLAKAKDILIESFEKHKVKVNKNVMDIPGNFDRQVMVSNIVLSELMMSVKGVLQFTIEDIATDRHGGCVVCKRHKSIGCQKDCARYRLKEIYTHVSKGLKIAKGPKVEEAAEFIKNRMKVV
jgi:hypothetical protein